jgi:CheY-like chemotaxis protein
VDDEDMILDVGTRMLKKLGYKVFTARDGIEAITVFQKHQEKIDVIVLDMIMPRMGGGETYDRIKDIKPRVKVLLSSGYSINGQASEILSRGCDGFIQKPFNLQNLSQNLRAILEGK